MFPISVISEEEKNNQRGEGQAFLGHCPKLFCIFLVTSPLNVDCWRLRYVFVCGEGGEGMGVGVQIHFLVKPNYSWDWYWVVAEMGLWQLTISKLGWVTFITFPPLLSSCLNHLEKFKTWISRHILIGKTANLVYSEKHLIIVQLGPACQLSSSLGPKQNTIFTVLSTHPPHPFLRVLSIVGGRDLVYWHSWKNI